MGELNVMDACLGHMITDLEAELNSDETVVRELVASFLLPQVERHTLRKQGKSCIFWQRPWTLGG